MRRIYTPQSLFTNATSSTTTASIINRATIFTRFSGVVMLGLISSLFTLNASAVPEDFFDKLAADARPAADKARDASRRPSQVLDFLGIEAGMTVIDVAAGAGWYTEVLSAAVGPDGQVITQAGQRMLEAEPQLQALAERLGNVEISFAETWDLNMAGQADAALTALSLHDNLNFRGEEGVANFLGGIYAALKPGGVLGVVDHIGNPGADNNTELHRIPLDRARVLIQQAGFIIESESNILRNLVDDHTLTNGSRALARATDRFVFRVRKP